MAPASPIRPQRRKGIHSKNNSPPAEQRVVENRSESGDEEEHVRRGESDSEPAHTREAVQRYLRTRATEERTATIANRSVSQSPSRQHVRRNTQFEQSAIRRTREGIVREGPDPSPLYTYVILIALFVLIPIIGLLSYSIFNKKAESETITVNVNPPQRQRKSCNAFENLKKKFPRQDSYLWRALEAGIEGILNNVPPSPSVFLFLHQNKDSTRELISYIVNTTAECFNPALAAATLGADFFASRGVLEDQGVAIDRYRKDLKDGGVLLITDLNKIPAQAAQALHFICDNVSPIIRETVIFLTLVPSSDVGNEVEIAENTLKMLWGPALADHILDPLITRITDQVIRLLPE